MVLAIVVRIFTILAEISLPLPLIALAFALAAHDYFKTFLLDEHFEPVTCVTASQSGYGGALTVFF